MSVFSFITVALCHLSLIKNTFSVVGYCCVNVRVRSINIKTIASVLWGPPICFVTLVKLLTLEDFFFYPSAVSAVWQCAPSNTRIPSPTTLQHRSELVWMTWMADHSHTAWKQWAFVEVGCKAAWKARSKFSSLGSRMCIRVSAVPSAGACFLSADGSGNLS